MQNMTVETLVRRLAYLGLVPFVLLAALVWMVADNLHPFVAIALVSYAGVIAAFLGGIHWGIGLRPNAPHGLRHIGWGVVPSLVAWVAVVMPAYAGLPRTELNVICSCISIIDVCVPTNNLTRKTKAAFYFKPQFKII